VCVWWMLAHWGGGGGRVFEILSNSGGWHLQLYPDLSSFLRSDHATSSLLDETVVKSVTSDLAAGADAQLAANAICK